jgi:hypothetical protein
VEEGESENSDVDSGEQRVLGSDVSSRMSCDQPSLNFQVRINCLYGLPENRKLLTSSPFAYVPSGSTPS